MEPRDFLLMAYSAFGGEIQGKTALQKKIYFLSLLLNESDKVEYRPHFFGPYSSQLAEANNDLLSLNFIQEAKNSSGMVDPNGFEIARYDYRLTGDGEAILSNKKNKYQQDWERIREAAQKIASAIVEAGNLNYSDLSIAAKAFFILDKANEPKTDAEIASLAKSFGWNVAEKEISKAIEFLKKIGLVE